MFGVVSGRGEPAREVDGCRIAICCRAVDVGAPREGQAEESCDLVEGLSCSIVERRTQGRDVESHVVDAQQ